MSGRSLAVWALVAVLALAASAPARAQVLAVPIPPVDDPLLAGLSIPGDAEVAGMWGPLMSWPMVAIHLNLLPDGSVLSYGSPIGQGIQEGRVFDRWDPLATSGGHVTLPNSQAVDSFCAAGVLQPFGDLLISGGNAPFASTRFDWVSGGATTESSALASERWYATMTMLADGRTLITGGSVPYETEAYNDPSGSLDVISMTPEIYTPGSGWSSLFGANSRDAFGPDYNRWWYPRQWVAPNGEVFGISSEKIWYLDPDGNGGDGSIRTVGTFKGPANQATTPNIGPTSTAVMYDVGRILQVGGNGYANGQATTSSRSATTFDITGGDPVITEIAPLGQRRQWANATVTPTGDVIVTGGTRFADNGGADAVYSAESWRPGAAGWTPLASAARIRNYHSTVILLPNGTLLSAGGGVPGPVTNFNAEIFYPPYLFEENGSGQTVLADLPDLVSISAERFTHDEPFQLELGDTRAIASLVLIGLSSTTHSFNMGQRYVPVSFSQTGTILDATAPASANTAPPGYYLLFAVDDAGRPSRGHVVAVGPSECALAAQCDDGDPCTDDLCSAGVCMNPDNGTCVPSTDPVARYAFDEGSGTTAADASGNDYHATLAGGAGWTTGRSGHAVQLAGGGPHVQVPAGIVGDCDDLTVATWVRLDANPTWARIFDFGSGTGTNMFLTPAAGNASTLRFALKVPGINGGAEAQINHAYAFPLGVWKHVAVVLQGNTGTLYLDGVAVATNAAIAADPADMGPTGANFLGDSQYSADPTLDGSLDDFEVSCRAYAPLEIAALAGLDVAVCGDDVCDVGEGCASCADDCGTCGATLLDADFEAGADGFSYADDTFRSTAQPLYAAGSASAGALQLVLGNVNETDITNMSGGFSRSFTLAEPAAVTLSIGWAISMPADYEPDECSEVLVALDGVLQGSGGADWVARHCGPASQSASFVFTTGVLEAGTHTLTLGGFSNQKTTASERTLIRFEQVSIVAIAPETPIPSLPAPWLAALALALALLLTRGSGARRRAGRAG